MAVPSRDRTDAALSLRLGRAAARAALAAAAVLLAGCATGEPPADWALSAHGALRNFESAALRGDARIAQAELARARAELARTGRPELLARAELLACAVRVASLEFDDCPAFQPLARDADAAGRNYAAYLAGRFDEVETALLPPAHRAVVAARGGGGAFLADIDAPLSRLVAAGVLMRTGRIAPADVSAAIQTASAQGWRKPLLAWLGVQERRALAAGERDAAARIRLRIDIILEAGKPR